MSSAYVLLVSVACAVLALTTSYPTGAPEETCRIFTANHTGHLPQRTQSKYDFKVSPTTVAPGGSVTVTLRGMGSETLKGFFIQGQDASRNTPIGKFRSQADAQTRDCKGPGSADAATHVNSNDKSSVVLTWQAPASFRGSVVFRAVVVKTYEQFWNNLRSNQLTVA